MEVYMIGKKRRTICSIYLTQTDLPGNGTPHSTYDTAGKLQCTYSLWGTEKMITNGRMLEKIFDRNDLLCLNKKDETYYRANRQ